MTVIIHDDRVQPLRKKYKKFIHGAFSVDTLKRRLPISKWLPKYNGATFLQDFIAGLTVGLAAIPQGLAYAVVAGLPAEYGLYSALTAGVIYAVLGTCKDLSVGPTAILSAITAKYVAGYSAEFAILVAFLSGFIILVMAVLRLGFLVEFISVPVISGFTIAAALQVSTSQITPLLGLEGGSGNYFAESIYNIVKNITTIKLWDTVLGCAAMIMLFLLQKMGDGCSRSGTRAQKCRWIISIGRNAIVVFIGMLMAYIFFIRSEARPFTLIGEIRAGLPNFGLPPFSAVVNNETYNFSDMLSALGPKFVVIPFVSLLEVTVLCKIFSEGQVDVTQEMIALAMCNIVGSMGKSMPITGSFSRTALNHVSNAVTPLGSVVTCALIVLSLTCLTSSFAFIPKASLAALIILAMTPLVNFDTIQHLWRNSKRELAVLLISLGVSLGCGLEFGIIAGVAIEACLAIYMQARPDLDVTREKHDGKVITVIKLSQSALYCSAEHIRRRLLKLSSEEDSIIIIDGINVSYLDYTVATNLMSFTKDLEKKSRHVVLLNFKPSIVGCCVDIYPESINKFIDSKNLSVVNVIK